MNIAEPASLPTSMLVYPWDPSLRAFTAKLWPADILGMEYSAAFAQTSSILDEAHSSATDMDPTPKTLRTDATAASMSVAST